MRQGEGVGMRASLEGLGATFLQTKSLVFVGVIKGKLVACYETWFNEKYVNFAIRQN